MNRKRGIRIRKYKKGLHGMEDDENDKKEVILKGKKMQKGCVITGSEDLEAAARPTNLFVTSIRIIQDMY